MALKNITNGPYARKLVDWLILKQGLFSAKLSHYPLGFDSSAPSTKNAREFSEIPSASLSIFFTDLQFEFF